MTILLLRLYHNTFITYTIIDNAGKTKVGISKRYLNSVLKSLGLRAHKYGI